MLSDIEQSQFLDFLSGNGRRLIAVIGAYIDESGTHKDAPLLSVACYFAPRSRWGAFERDWMPILKRHGITCFHAVNRDHDKLRPSLCELIQHCRLNAVIVSVSRSVYDLWASAQMRSVLGDPYAACVTNCVIKVCTLTKKKYYGESVSFVIEAGQPKTEHLELKIKSMMDRPLYRDCAPISSVTLAEKEGFVPLQTADFLSHVFSTREIYWINELSKNGLMYSSFIDQKALKESSNELKNIFRRNRWIHKNIAKNLAEN